MVPHRSEKMVETEDTSPVSIAADEMKENVLKLYDEEQWKDIQSNIIKSSDTQSEEEIKDVVGEDIYNIMQNVPKEEFKNANLDYIYSLIWKELDAEEIQELEEDPYYSDKRNNTIDETQMLSAFGLNKN